MSSDSQFVSHSNTGLRAYVARWRAALDAAAPTSLVAFDAIQEHLRAENEFFRALCFLGLCTANQRLHAVTSLVEFFLVRTQMLVGALEPELDEAQTWATGSLRELHSIPVDTPDLVILEDQKLAEPRERLVRLHLRLTVLPRYLQQIGASDLADELLRDSAEFGRRWDRGDAEGVPPIAEGRCVIIPGWASALEGKTIH